MGVVGDHQHRHQDRGEETGQGSDPNRRVGKIALLRNLQRCGAGRKRSDGGIDDHKLRRASVVEGSSGPTPTPREIIKFRTIAPIIVPRNPATTASHNGPIEVPIATPISAPTAVPTTRTISNSAEVISYPPSKAWEPISDPPPFPGTEYAPSLGMGKAARFIIPARRLRSVWAGARQSPDTTPRPSRQCPASSM